MSHATGSIGATSRSSMHVLGGHPESRSKNHWGTASMSGASPPTWADVRQALEAIKGNQTSRLALRTSVAFSILALAVSLLGYCEQRSANESQKGINEDQRRAIEDQILVNDEGRADKQREYAVRVHWWTDNTSNSPVYIQNRSPIPIRQVALRYKMLGAGDFGLNAENVPLYTGAPVIMIVTIPPCTILTLDGEAIEELYLGSIDVRADRSDRQAMYWSRLDFNDVHGTWSVQEDGTLKTRASSDSVESVEGDLGLWSGGPHTEVEPAADCGTG